MGTDIVVHILFTNKKMKVCCLREKFTFARDIKKAY